MKYTMDDFINMEIAVRTGTGENYEKFLKMCDERGLRWKMGETAVAYVPDSHVDDCCISYGYTKANVIEYGGADEYTEGGWTIVDFSDIVSEQPDAVSHPSHYTQGGIECKDALAAMISSFKDPNDAALSWQIVKYIWRHPHKGKPLEDLQKAKFYLDWLIRRNGGES